MNRGRAQSLQAFVQVAGVAPMSSVQVAAFMAATHAAASDESKPPGQVASGHWLLKNCLQPAMFPNAAAESAGAHSNKRSH